MKYAIVESGGKQYRAVPGDAIEVDRLQKNVGDTVELDVLLVSDGEQVTVGTPVVAGMKVQASVEAHVKGPKVVSFRYTAKERIRRKKGHRQQYTRLKIEAF